VRARARAKNAPKRNEKSASHYQIARRAFDLESANLAKYAPVKDCRFAYAQCYFKRDILILEESRCTWNSHAAGKSLISRNSRERSRSIFPDKTSAVSPFVAFLFTASCLIALEKRETTLFDRDAAFQKQREREREREEKESEEREASFAQFRV